MSAIVNERDRILQSASQRIAETLMSAGITIKQDAVEGLGLVVVDSRLVILSASSQIFRIPKDIAGVPQPVVPQVISFTPTIKGLPPTPVFSVIRGNAALSFANGGALLNYDDMNTDIVTVRCSVSDAVTAYFDDVSVVKVREGTDALVGLLTNESHTVSADYLGNVLSYSGAGGNFIVYQGATDITTACTFSVVTATPGVTTTINLQGVYTVTSIPSGSDSITVTYLASFGSTSIPKTFSITKSKQGVPGSANAGQRGSMTFYVSITGTIWSDSIADAAALATGVKVLNDTVQETNTLAQFTETRFWNGANWVKINAFVDGNLLVTGTVGTQALSANSVTAGKLGVGSITATSAAVASLDASKLTAGSISATVIATDTLTTNMIVGKSCTATDLYIRSVTNGVSSSYSFTMDHAGWVTAHVITNFTATGVSGNFSLFCDINATNQNQMVALSVPVQPSWSLYSFAFLQAGTHNVNIYAYTSIASGNHTEYVHVLRSYR